MKLIIFIIFFLPILNADSSLLKTFSEKIEQINQSQMCQQNFNDPCDCVTDKYKHDGSEFSVKRSMKYFAPLLEEAVLNTSFVSGMVSMAKNLEKLNEESNIHDPDMSVMTRIGTLYANLFTAGAMACRDGMLIPAWEWTKKTTANCTSDAIAFVLPESWYPVWVKKNQEEKKLELSIGNKIGVIIVNFKQLYESSACLSADALEYIAATFASFLYAQALEGILVAGGSATALTKAGVINSSMSALQKSTAVLTPAHINGQLAQGRLKESVFSKLIEKGIFKAGCLFNY